LLIMELPEEAWAISTIASFYSTRTSILIKSI
jgi:hypothetical protein